MCLVRPQLLPNKIYGRLTDDITVFALPFPVLATLTLSTRQIIALCVTFGLGLITIAVSIGRCMALLQNAFVPLCMNEYQPISRLR
jgi:hypothetical protein